MEEYTAKNMRITYLFEGGIQEIEIPLNYNRLENQSEPPQTESSQLIKIVKAD